MQSLLAGKLHRSRMVNTGALTVSGDLVDDKYRTKGNSIYAGQFTAANSEYLSHAHNSDLSTGDIDFTFAVWVYADSLLAAGRFA